MTLTLIADIAVAVLLAVAIVYAVRLNRQLVAMHRGRAELETAATSFEKATGRAGDSIARLKTSTQQLQEAVQKAETLRDDMTFLLERGTSVADRLEGIVRTARKTSGTGAGVGGTGGLVDDDEARAELVADRALRAGGRVVPGPGRSRPRPEGAAPKPAAPDARSEAEKDLLRAIRAAR